MGKLPLKGSEQAQVVMDLLAGGQIEKASALCGYTRKDNFLRAVKGIWGEEPPPGGAEVDMSKVEEPVINIPAIKIRHYKPIKRGRGDPETQVLLLGDHHAGEVTPTYNAEVYKKRLQKVFEATILITDLHRHMYPVNELVVIMLGDMVHGENPYQGAKLGSADRGAVEQVYELAFPEMLSLLSSFRENFKSIRVYGIWGNHGRVSRESPRTSNWDNMLYKALAKAKLPSGIEIFPPDNFCQTITIGGFRFFAYHGDQIAAHSGIPYFAQRRKVMNWYTTFGGFAYAIQGHFHEEDIIRVSAKTKGFINGSLVTDDPFALERIGTSGIPCQWTFGVHERHGVTWAYNLTLDDAFLPDRLMK